MSIGQIIRHDAKNYWLSVDGNVVSMPVATMHRMVVFPTTSMEGSHLKNGETVYLYERDADNGDTYYYPDHRVYELKSAQKEQQAQGSRPMDSRSLMEGTADWSDLELSTLDIANKWAEMAAHLDQAERNRGMEVIMRNDLLEFRDYFSRYFSLTKLPEENQQMEYKSSFIHPSSNNRFPGKKNPQFCVIVESLAGFANARTKGTLYVGVHDKTKDIVGVEQDIVDFNPSFTREKFETCFVNFIRQYTGQAMLPDAIHICWGHLNGHLLCRFDVDVWTGDVILCDGCRLLVRQGASNVQYTGGDMLNFIRTHHPVSAN